MNNSIMKVNMIMKYNFDSMFVFVLSTPLLPFQDSFDEYTFN